MTPELRKLILEHDYLVAENEQLRKALEKIASFPDEAMKVALTMHWDMRGWAREALAAATDEQEG